MSEKKSKLEPTDSLKEAFANHSKAKAVFNKHKMRCAACKGFSQEQMRHAAQCHGLDVHELIKEICAED